MKNISVHLQKFVKLSLHPTTLAGQQLTTNEFEKWKIFINEEIAKLSVVAFKASVIYREYKFDELLPLTDQLIDLSNTINSYMLRYTKVWKTNSGGDQIKQHYLLTCQVFEDFMESVAKRFPSLGAKMVYSDFALWRIKQELKLLANTADQHLQKQIIGPEIRNVLLDGIRHMIGQRLLKRKDDLYLRRLMADIIKTKFDDSGRLIDFLIKNDFNMPEFFLFCVANWTGQLNDLEGLYEQKQFLLDVKTHLYDLTLSRDIKYPDSKNYLYIELNNFLTEKYSIIKERLKISRQLASDDQLRPRAKRMLINLSVAQLGLFIRLQVEKGFLAKEHLGELFAFYARHFYTPNTDFISSESLQKKSTDVEHATAKKLKAHLIAMLNWLNTNYNLSNYN